MKEPVVFSFTRCECGGDMDVRTESAKSMREYVRIDKCAKCGNSWMQRVFRVRVAEDKREQEMRAKRDRRHDRFRHQDEDES